MIGILTGRRAGIFVVDRDPPDGLANLKELEEKYGDLPLTFEVRTPRGGMHKYFLMPEDGRKVKSSVSNLAKNIDIRADGAYVITAPSVNEKGGQYTIVDPDPATVAAPEWLLKLINTPSQTADDLKKRPSDVVEAAVVDVHPYARRALEQELKSVCTAAKSTRNCSLNNAALKLFGFVASGNLPEDLVQHGLEEAAEVCGLTADDGLQSVRATIASARCAGMASPRSLPSGTGAGHCSTPPSDTGDLDTWQPVAEPEFPVLGENALTGLAGEFVELATENSEASRASVLMSFLCRFGCEAYNAETGGPYFEIGDTHHAPRLFAVIVGATSTARKGTSAETVKKLFDFQMDMARPQTSPGPLSSGEGAIFAVRDAVIGLDEKTGEERIVDAGAPDKRLFILDGEFASALRAIRREGNTLSTIIIG